VNDSPSGSIRRHYILVPVVEVLMILLLAWLRNHFS
jgi:hypothetical protein